MKAHNHTTETRCKINRPVFSAGKPWSKKGFQFKTPENLPLPPPCGTAKSPFAHPSSKPSVSDLLQPHPPPAPRPPTPSVQQPTIMKMTKKTLQQVAKSLFRLGDENKTKRSTGNTKPPDFFGMKLLPHTTHAPPLPPPLCPPSVPGPAFPLPLFCSLCLVASFAPRPAGPRPSARPPLPLPPTCQGRRPSLISVMPGPADVGRVSCSNQKLGSVFTRRRCRPP